MIKKLSSIAFALIVAFLLTVGHADARRSTVNYCSRAGAGVPANGTASDSASWRLYTRGCYPTGSSWQPHAYMSESGSSYNANRIAYNEASSGRSTQGIINDLQSQGFDQYDSGVWFDPSNP